MFSIAVIKALQVYGIAIAVSFLVAALIKVMVAVMGRLERPAAGPAVATTPVVATKVAAEPRPGVPDEVAAEPRLGIPDEVVAAISAAVAVVVGPHRILHISEANSSWTQSGRAVHHASHSGHFQPRS